MGLFAKIHGTSQELPEVLCIDDTGAFSSRPSIKEERPPSTAMREDTVHRGLYERARAVKTSDAVSALSPARTTEACLNSLSRMEARDCETAISVLKAFFSFEYLLCFTVSGNDNAPYATFGLDGRSSPSNTLAALRSLTAHGQRRLSGKELPPRFQGHPAGELVLAPIADGSEAWVLLASPPLQPVDREALLMFSSPMANRFLPRSRERRQSAPRQHTPEASPTPLSKPRAQKMPSAREISATTGSPSTLLCIDKCEDSASVAEKIRPLVPGLHTVFAAPSGVLAIAGPRDSDLELLWFHLCKGLFTGNEAHTMATTFFAALDEEALEATLAEHGKSADGA